jgi:hypothetical protein
MMEAGYGAQRRQQLVELVDYPRETVSIELKEWMDLGDSEVRAHIARELLALANHGGGFLIFGFADGEESEPKPLEPIQDLTTYSQDAINSIVERYAEPRFEVTVSFVGRSDGHSTHPVIEVPSDTDTPIRAARDGPERRHVTQHTYYTRQPGAQSAPIRTGREWDVLIDRCIRARREDLVERMRELLEGAQPSAEIDGAVAVAVDRSLADFIGIARSRFEELIGAEPDSGYPEPYQYGTWYFAYRVLGARHLELSELRTVLQDVVGHETGWPAWWWPGRTEVTPHPWEGRIECWMTGGTFADSGHSDYWLADPDGLLILLRGYDDDATDRGAPRDPGTLMDLTLPTWRVGECLLHAERYAAAVAEEPESAQVEVEAHWEGLKGRDLATWAEPMRMMSPHPNRAQDAVTSRLRVQADGISARLPELVKELVRPLYESFDFFQPPDSMYREELDRLRGRRNR